MEKNIEKNLIEESSLPTEGDIIDPKQYIKVNRFSRASGNCEIPLQEKGKIALINFFIGQEPLLHNKNSFTPSEQQKIIARAQEEFNKAPIIKKEITPSLPKKKKPKEDNAIPPRPKQKKTITTEEFTEQLERYDPHGYDYP